MVEVAAGPSDSSPHEKVSLFSNSTTPPGGGGVYVQKHNISTTAPPALNASSQLRGW